MLMAQGAWDLQRLSGGRFELGLGSQVHGQYRGALRRPWTPPGARMRDYVRALRAIFARWQDGTPLAFESEHYRLSRMQPFFDPGPLEQPRTPDLARRGESGDDASRGRGGRRRLDAPDQFRPRTLREVTRPALAAGAARAGRRRRGVAIHACPLHRDRARCRAVARGARAGPRDAHLPVFDARLLARARSARLGRGGRAAAPPDARGRLGRDARARDRRDAREARAAGLLRARSPTCSSTWFGGLATRIAFPLPADPAHDAEIAKVVARLRAA